jgi:uncharacterized protein YcfJ
MKRQLQAVLAALGIALATQAAAQITFYEREGFHGRAFTTDDRIGNLERIGFNDSVSSVLVQRGRWEVCEHPRFEGRCAILRPGSYPSLREAGLDNRISSVRRVHGREHADDRQPIVVAVVPHEPRPLYVPPPVAPAPVFEPPRPAFYEVPVTSVRAVVGPPTQRCWIEREQVVQQQRGEPNLGGAVIGGIVGGVLGHQVGGGSGKDLATVGGAVAGAAIGANVNRGTSVATVGRDVQRCENVTNAQPAYWDVTYSYRGSERRVQMTTAPGATLRVHPDGSPVVVAR